jgi:hypothetical protein
MKNIHFACLHVLFIKETKHTITGIDGIKFNITNRWGESSMYNWPMYAESTMFQSIWFVYTASQQENNSPSKLHLIFYMQLPK